MENMADSKTIFKMEDKGCKEVLSHETSHVKA